MSMTTTIFGTISQIYDKRVVGNDKQSVIDFSVAVNHNKRDSNGEWQQESATFQKVTLWGSQADNFEKSMEVGDRVIVTGEVITGKKYQDKEGNERFPQSSIKAKAFGPELSFTTAEIARKPKKGGSGPATKKRNTTPANKTAVNNVDDGDIFDEDEDIF